MRSLTIGTKQRLSRLIESYVVRRCNPGKSIFSKNGPLQHRYERAFYIIDDAKKEHSRSRKLLTVQHLLGFCRSVMSHKIVSKLYLENLWNILYFPTKIPL